MADRHESDGRESPESPQAGRSGELHPITSGATSTERDDTHVPAENEYFSALDLADMGEDLGGEPEDMAQIRSDDALLDALAAQVNGALGTNGRHPDTMSGVVDFDDEQLNALLLAWRQDVDSVPVPVMVDTTAAVATVTAAKSARRRRPRMLVPVAAAAAVLVGVFAGVGIAARDAQPGDALWGLSKVLYADHARSVEAAQSVRSDLNDAQQALQQGKIDAAKDALQAASSQLPAVSSEDGKDALQAKHESLMQQLSGTTGPIVPTTLPAQRSDSSRAEQPQTPTPSTSTQAPSSEKPSSQPPSSTSSAPSSAVQPPSSSSEPSAGSGPPRSDSPGSGGGGGGVSGQSTDTNQTNQPSGT
ncbi:anti-sigma-D factor RsdA [Actinocrispum wychmicini]|uniref:Anti-sigma-D factor RsdA-like protein n=1 Tax=Actinocrispum wychmicini TaxID=1213861 RepID=A0A4V2S8W8_9PSEU|nr:anti-sigma-D factor RsdA [Actinocrispum wychmicini]TCO65430.1 anti-sigma-D factor RsdA-like protein [Actinocrispum wychmicini]